MYDVEKIRKDFPVLTQVQNGKPLIYLDTAATAQKPTAVIDKLCVIYATYYANVHRGTYPISEKITTAFEQARQTVADFIHADSKEIVFPLPALFNKYVISNSLKGFPVSIAIFFSNSRSIF